MLLNLHDKSYYRLNETAAAVWAGFEKGESRDEIVSSMLKEFAVDPETAAREIDQTIDDMKERGLLLDESATR